MINDIRCSYRLKRRWYHAEDDAQCSYKARLLSPCGKFLCRTHAKNIDGCLPIEQALLQRIEQLEMQLEAEVNWCR